MRRTLAESLRTCEASFYSRWHDYEAFQAACHYILDENQCRRDWDNVLSAASQPRKLYAIFSMLHFSSMYGAFGSVNYAWLIRCSVLVHIYFNDFDLIALLPAFSLFRVHVNCQNHFH